MQQKIRVKFHISRFSHALLLINVLYSLSQVIPDFIQAYLSKTMRILSPGSHCVHHLTPNSSDVQLYQRNGSRTVDVFKVFSVSKGLGTSISPRLNPLGAS